MWMVTAAELCGRSILGGSGHTVPGLQATSVDGEADGAIAAAIITREASPKRTILMRTSSHVAR